MSEIKNEKGPEKNKGVNTPVKAQKAADKVIYIGPNFPKWALITGTVFTNGIPQRIADENVKKLFVKISETSAALVEVSTVGSVLYNAAKLSAALYKGAI